MAEEIENDPVVTESGGPGNGNVGENSSERRVPRSIRFSDSEWKLIERVAKERGMAAAELVRHVSVGIATGKFTEDSSGEFPTSLPKIFQQVERIYNGVYMLATLKRDEMLREGRQDELDRVINDARRTRENFQACPSSD